MVQEGDGHALMSQSVFPELVQVISTAACVWCVDMHVADKGDSG